MKCTYCAPSTNQSTNQHNVRISSARHGLVAAGQSEVGTIKLTLTLNGRQLIGAHGLGFVPNIFLLLKHCIYSRSNNNIDNRQMFRVHAQ
jgi:hypothetical protein